MTSCTELLEALGAGASPLPWFLDGFDLVIQASGLRNDALVDVRRALEAALPRSRPGSGEHADGA